MRERGVAYGLRWAVALTAMYLVLVLPDRPDAFRFEYFRVFPVELPFVLALVLAAPPRWRRAVRIVVAAALVLLLAAKIADIAMFAALGRAFNPVLDLGLVVHGVDLLGRAFGGAGAVALLVSCALLLSGVVAAIVWAFGAPAGPAVGVSRERRRAALACIGAGVLALAANLGFGGGVVTAWSSRFVADHAAEWAAGVVDLERFRAAAAADAFRDVPDDRLLAGLAGRDVMLVFVESYGRSVIDEETGVAGAKAALADLAQAVEAAGFAARSAWLTSPVRGGQSWLAHATLLSGLWVDNQRRFDSLTVSDRRTLIADFAHAGWRTVAVMPALTFDWPPAAFYGYDRLYAAGDLGYRGAPFNWVTMPDQYTLAAFSARELAAERPQPVLAEIALISSHAPWTPIPPLLPWDAVGDGSIFTPYADAGDPPEVVWRDPDRVREQYRKAIAYTLATLAGFVGERAKAAPRRDWLMIIVGDHQPVPFVSGDPQTFEVPLHLISSDPALLTALGEAGWTPGVVPAADAPAWRMDEFRARLLSAFTPGAAAPLPTARQDRPNGPG